jgi:hypothetical protein
MFFIEKKNQKTFAPWGPLPRVAALDESLLASFSSEKEALASLA